MFIFSLCNKEQAFLKLGQFQQCLIFNLVQWYNRVGIDIAVSVILNTIFVNNLYMHDITLYANKLATKILILFYIPSFLLENQL